MTGLLFTPTSPISYMVAPALLRLKQNIDLINLFDTANKAAWEVWKVTESQIKSKSRQRPIVKARSFGMFCMREIGECSLKKTGRLYHRDHSTVLNSFRRIKNARDGFEPEYLEEFERAEKILDNLLNNDNGTA